MKMALYQYFHDYSVEMAPEYLFMAIVMELVPEQVFITIVMEMVLRCLFIWPGRPEPGKCCMSVLLYVGFATRRKQSQHIKHEK